MWCSDAAANVLTGGSRTLSKYLRPTYTIDSSYAQLADTWIASFSQKKKSPASFPFSAADSSSTSWSDQGFKDTDVSVKGSYAIFFSATYTENNKTVTKNISAEDASSEIVATVTMTDHALFTISSGKWSALSHPRLNHLLTVSGMSPT